MRGFCPWCPRFADTQVRLSSWSGRQRDRDTLASPDVKPRDVPVSLGRYDIVYFGNDWFAEQLARRTRVLYVDVPGLRAPKANGRDLRKIPRALLAAVRRPRQVGDRF